jgi:uncharacterized membrane protein
MRTAQAVALIAATMTMGLMAGVFGLYAHAVMPGLAKTDDRTFIGAFQQIDEAIEQPRFMPVFLGAIVFTAAAGALHVGDGDRSVLPWIAVALALYLAVVIITGVVNVPLNHDLRAAGDPDRISDLAAVRERFDETRWVTWNVVRTVFTTVAFGLLSWALVLHGRL